jgi:uncharacterized membrane protein YkoI
MARIVSRRNAIVASAIVGIGLAGGGAAIAMSGDDDATERPIAGAALQKASAAALDHVGGGRVTGTEMDDEESLYEVEVTRTDGSQVDVQLDAGFGVVGAKADREEGG